MIGVGVRVDRLDQPNIKLAHQLQIAVNLVEHGIDDQRLPAAIAGEEIAVGAGDAIE